MTKMQRKQIYIKQRQQVILHRLARQRGVSEAEVIRQVIEREALLDATRMVNQNRTALEEFIRFGLSCQSTAESTTRTWTHDELYGDFPEVSSIHKSTR